MGQIANLPQLVHRGEDEPDGAGVDAAQDGHEPALGTQRAPQSHEAHHDHQPRGMDGDKGNEGPCEPRQAGAGRGQRAEVDGEVVVWAWEGLDDGEAQEEVSGRDPAFGDDILAEEGDDDRTAAENDGARKVKVGEQGEAAWGILDHAAENERGDERDEKED